MNETRRLAAGQVQGDAIGGMSKALRRQFAITLTVILVIAFLLDLALADRSSTVTAARLDHTSLSKTPPGPTPTTPPPPASLRPPPSPSRPCRPAPCRPIPPPGGPTGC